MRAIPSLLVLAWLLPCAASGQPGNQPGEEGHERDRWIPALGIEVGFLSQDGKSSSSTSLVMGPALDPNPQLIREPDSGGGNLLGATFSGSLELTTPALDVRGAPRLFGRVGVSGLLSSPKRINQEGSLAPLEDPGSVDSEDDILGQGSATEADVDSFLTRAGLGISISLPLGDRTLRLKPSIEYLFEEITVSGIAHRAVQVNSPMTSIADTRLISFKGKKTEEFHGIGPGLEFETDAVRGGDFVWSVYAGAAAYYFLGDLDVEVNDSDAPPGPGFGESASWKYEKEDWGFHFGVGMRLRWLPE